MNKITFLLLFAFYAIACNEKKTGTFTIKGDIVNFSGKKIMLVEMPIDNGQPIILDTTFLETKGSFILKGKAKEEGIYRLVLENGPDVILINDNPEIDVHLDVNNYRSYTTKGSPASESLHRLFEDYHTKDSIIAANFKQVELLQQIPGNDSSINVIKTANDKQVESLKSLLTEYINNNPSSAAVFYALGIAKRNFNSEELKSLVASAAARFPEHSGLARVKTMMATKPAEQKPAEKPATNEGMQAPDLTMPGLDGKSISISSFRGKYLLVDFWASWCGPCRGENPNVVAAYNKYKNKNFTILGVSLDQNKDSWKAAVEKDNLTWSHMSDLKYWQSAAVQAYGFDGIPFNVLLDPSGKIIASGLRGEELDKKLAEVLK